MKSFRAHWHFCIRICYNSAKTSSGGAQINQAPPEKREGTKPMSMQDLPRLASLIKSRNTVEGKIAALIGRSAQAGNVGEFIAASIFRISLDEPGRSTGYDGRFTHGLLAGQTVDIQWHPRHDGQINIRPDFLPNYYLILSGPETPTTPFSNPWLIEHIYLFHAQDLMNALHERGVQIGSGTSVTGPLWERNEIYPVPRNQHLILSEEERRMLVLFG